jgi:hypothetical protein
VLRQGDGPVAGARAQPRARAGIRLGTPRSAVARRCPCPRSSRPARRRCAGSRGAGQVRRPVCPPAPHGPAQAPSHADRCAASRATDARHRLRSSGGRRLIGRRRHVGGALGEDGGRLGVGDQFAEAEEHVLVARQPLERQRSSSTRPARAAPARRRPPLSGALACPVVVVAPRVFRCSCQRSRRWSSP